MKYFVTGATGHLGQKVVKHLRMFVKETDIAVGIHNPAKQSLFAGTGLSKVHLDYSQPSSLDQAFSGVDVLIYIPSITYVLADRIREFENVLASAKKANVSQFIFVSFFADSENNQFQMAPFYAYVPRRLAGSGLSYSYVKNTLYADPLIPYLPELIERGHVIYPVGDQPLSFISRDDSAKAVASLAVQPAMQGQGRHYLLSMPQNYNMVQLSHLLAKVSGQPITYQPVTVEQFAQIYANDGGSDLASMYAAGAKGLLSATSDDYSRLTGESPTSMAEFLAQHYRL